jgi:hypothetical protein
MKVVHRDVFRAEGAFAGWPANYGLWSWETELVCVFALGRVGAKGEIHELDRDCPFIPCQVRSRDGGQTWIAERFPAYVPAGLSLSADEHLNAGQKTRPRLDLQRDLRELEEPIDFLDPETIIMCARTGLSKDAVSWFYVSTTRGRNWSGPYRFRGLELSVAARTDIVPLGNREALCMLTTSKSDGKEGRVFCAASLDGGQSFEFRSFLGEEPSGYQIMPSSIIMQGGEILTAVRCKGAEDDRGWIELFASIDRGKSWTRRGVGVDDTGSGGNPPALAHLGHDNLALIYGYRRPPFGIRMRISSDASRSWGAECVLRGDGGTPDLGYPRVSALNENTLLAVYYFNDGEGQERYIAASKINLDPGSCALMSKAKRSRSGVGWIKKI